ncbi:hypothetical protein QBC40DRAFT_276077 [Triangularia verruculosa]|uniref:Uncharacterized protein n=1 Tax=Triangularia verruculosa TaxID=2587418 RepID=A0AAN7AZB7_9PEZI|nr:hypothetical protein QBC40DRAFT_276077 [Triangularia verruculosa]
MAASNPNRFSFRNPFTFFTSSSTTTTNNNNNNSDNTNNKSRPNSPRKSISRPNSPISSSFWSSLYRKTSSTSANTSSTTMSSSPVQSPGEPLSLTSSPATSLEEGYFPSLPTNPNSASSHLKPNAICGTCGSRSTESLVPPSVSTAAAVPPVIKRNATAPVIHVQPPVPGRKQIRVDPLSTQFPKPAAELSVEELMARKPGRWTLTQWVEKQKVVVVDEERKVKDDAEKRRREMEEVKRELRALASGL